MPLNGLVKVRSPLSDSTSLNDDSQLQNTNEWLCADAHINYAVKLLTILNAYLPSGFVSLAQNAKFLYFHGKYTPITTKTHPLNALFLHVPAIRKDLR